MIKMPRLRVETNVSGSSFDIDQLSAELMAAVAETLGKPIDYCMVAIIPDVHLRMGTGSEANKPVANVSLMSIGDLGLDENKKHSAVLFPILMKHLGVDGQRAFIRFIDAKSQDVGFDGTTFHELLG